MLHTRALWSTSSRLSGSTLKRCQLRRDTFSACMLSSSVIDIRLETRCSAAERGRPSAIRSCNSTAVRAFNDRIPRVRLICSTTFNARPD